MPSVNRPLSFIVFFATLSIVCVLVAFVSVRLMSPQNWRAHDEPQGHQWLHRKLDLTPDEAAAIDAFEAPYRAERERLMLEFDVRVQAIADLLKQHDSVTPEVTRAVHDLHLIHGQLQELSIQHYFDMLEVLPEEKKEKLRGLAVEALSKPQ